jgi:hypothetical protein
MILETRVRLGLVSAIAAWILSTVPPGQSQSLVPNWQFDEGDTGWWIGITGDATGSYAIDNSGMLSGPNSVKIQIDEGGTVDWYVMPDATVSMEKGKKYDLTFMAYADAVMRVSALIGESGGAYTVYWQKAFTIGDTTMRFGPFGTSKQPYTWACTRSEGVFELKFLFGRYDFVTIWLDSVALKEHVDTAVDERRVGTPDGFRLEPNYPNPFNPSTTIRYSLPGTSPIRLAVYDVRGAEKAVLFEGMQAAGSHSVQWTADGAFESGVYFIRLEADGLVRTHKATLLK